VFQDSINKTIKEYLANFTYFTQLMEYYGFQLVKREDAVALGLPNGTGMFSELFTRMEQDIEQDMRQKNRYGSAMYMTPIEKQISFYNRYFVFKKTANVDVEDVFRSVTGINVFQEKMNIADSASVQKLALQITGDGLGKIKPGMSAKGNVALSYRASKVSDLEKLGAEGVVEDTEILDLEEPGSGVSGKKKDATISKLFGSSKSKSPKSPKSKQPEEDTSASQGSVSRKLVVKKKSALEPVNLSAASAPASAASIVAKSKAGTKVSLSKIGKLNLGSIGESKSSKDE
jgi:hypothetical protein